MRQLRRNQPMHVKMEEKYKEEVEFPLLEQKKRKLEEIRQFFKKPLDIDGIAQHQRKYETE